MAKTRLTVDESRDIVLQRIAELEPEAVRLRAERRRATKAQREAMRACSKVEVELAHWKRYLYSLAIHVANGDVPTYIE